MGEDVQPIQAVLFDVDGTLIDTEELIAQSLAHACRLHLGREHPREEYLKLIGRPVAVQMEILGGPHAAEMIPAAMDYYEEHPELEREFGEAVDALRRIHAAGFKTGLVTSKVRMELEPTLERHGLHRYAPLVVTADQTPRPKPYPDPVLFALEQLGVEPAAALFVGDSPYDMAAGRDAGARTAAALWGPHSREALAVESPTYWLESPRDLLRVLDLA